MVKGGGPGARIGEVVHQVWQYSAFGWGQRGRLESQESAWGTGGKGVGAWSLDPAVRFRRG